MALNQGKVPSKILEKIFQRMKIKDKRVLVGPRIGFDSAVIEADGNIFVVSNDPSGFLPENIPIDYFAFGAVHWPASDVAVFGAKPVWMIYTIMFPIGISEEFVEKTIKSIYNEAKNLKIDIIGGHSGIYKSVNSTIASSTVIGEVEENKLVLPSNAKKGDLILMTKHLGLEISVALSYGEEEIVKKLLGGKTLRKLQESFRQLSVVKEARLLSEKRLANAMHDVTEGGLSVAIRELAGASNLGFEIFEERLPVPDYVKKLSERFGIDLYNTSNTGSLLAAIPPEKSEEAINVLNKHGVKATIIGKFTDEGAYLVKKGKRKSFPSPATDNYAKIFS